MEGLISPAGGIIRKRDLPAKGSPNNRPTKQKKPWTDMEDRTLREQVKLQLENYDTVRWTVVAEHLHGRIGKQCRDRWKNHLCPEIKKGAWSKEEDELLFEKHKIHGNLWADIAKYIPGRTDLSVKNRFYSLKRRTGRYHKPYKTTITEGVSCISLKNQNGGSAPGKTRKKAKVQKCLGTPPSFTSTRRTKNAKKTKKKSQRSHLTTVAIAVATAISMTEQTMEALGNSHNASATLKVCIESATVALVEAQSQSSQVSPIQKVVPPGVLDPTECRIFSIEEHVAKLLGFGRNGIQTGQKPPTQSSVCAFRRTVEKDLKETNNVKVDEMNLLSVDIQ